MNQHVLVIAGTWDIEREIMRAFAAKGATVCVCGMDARGLKVWHKKSVGW